MNERRRALSSAKLLETASLWPDGIQRMHLTGCRIDSEFLGRLAQSEAAASIRSLVLSECYVNDTGLKHLAAFAALRKVRMKKCWHVSSSGVISLSQHCPSLEVLSVKDLKWSMDRVLHHLAEASVPLPCLRHLTLWAKPEQMTRSAFDHFIRCRGNEERMQRLKLPVKWDDTSGSIPPDDAHLAESAIFGMKRMRNLEFFPLRCHVRMSDLLVRSMEGLTSWLNEVLEETEEEDSRPLTKVQLVRGAQDVANKLKHLTSLDVKINDDYDIPELWMNLPCVSKLGIRLYGNALTGRAMKPILRTVTQMASLQRLHLMDVDIDIDDLEQVATLPQLCDLALLIALVYGERTSHQRLEAIISSMVSLRSLYLMFSTRQELSGGEDMLMRLTIRHPELTLLDFCDGGWPTKLHQLECPNLRKLCCSQGYKAQKVGLLSTCSRLEKIWFNGGSPLEFANLALLAGWVPRLRHLRLTSLKDSCAESSPLELRHLERLLVSDCMLSTTNLERLVKSAPRLHSLSLLAAQHIHTLEGLTSTSLCSLDLHASSSLTGVLELQGCRHLRYLRLRGPHTLSEIRLIAMEELTEASLACRTSLRRLIIKDNARLHKLRIKIPRLHRDPREVIDRYMDAEARDAAMRRRDRRKMRGEPCLEEMTMEGDSIEHLTVNADFLMEALESGKCRLPKLKRLDLFDLERPWRALKPKKEAYLRGQLPCLETITLMCQSSSSTP